MKKIILIISALIVYIACMSTNVYADGNYYVDTVPDFTGNKDITIENSPELWKKFLKYDLCITDYNSLTDNEKDLCRFIFETELNSPDTIICERARRILAGYDVGKRVTLDAVKQTPHIEDKSLYCRNGAMVIGNYIDAVPDIKHIDYDCHEFEYWLNDYGTEKITETNYNSEAVYSIDKYYRYEVYEDNICVESTYIKEKLDKPEVILDDVFRYYAYADNTLYVYQPIDKTSKYYEVPEEVNGMKVIGISNRAFEN